MLSRSDRCPPQPRERGAAKGEAGRQQERDRPGGAGRCRLPGKAGQGAIFGGGDDRATVDHGAQPVLQRGQMFAGGCPEAERAGDVGAGDGGHRIGGRHRRGKPGEGPHDPLLAVQLGVEAGGDRRDRPVHGAAQGFLVGRSILSNAAVHANAKAILKMDIKEFFPTVTVRRVKGVFRRAGYRDGISTLLALICTEAPREIVEVEGKTYYVSLGPRCLPQGAPTSPSLTNALCMRLDRRLEGLAKKLGWRYTRYADDLTFSLPAEHKGKPRLGTMIGCVTRIVAAEGFEVKAEKTRVHRTGGRQSVTGLVVNGDGPPRVSRTLRRQLRSAVHKLKTGKPLKEGESLARLSGYAAFVYMTNPDLGKKLLADINGATGAG